MTGHTIDLALQGGGSHGAFTWGVLDRLLEDADIEIGGLSGTSAGAMNAVVLCSGLATGGRQGARDALSAFWEAVGKAGSASLFAGTPLDLLFTPLVSSMSPMQKFFDVMSRLVSPYQINPWNINPLRDLLADHVNFDLVKDLEQPRIFINATNVRTGHNEVFRNPQIDLDTVLASACLPVIFHTVEIADEAYWDGGYTANPALLPLIEESIPNDLILVQINPVERPGIPRAAHDIIDRINEISFNSSLNQELRSIALIKNLLQEEASSGHSYRAPLFAKIDSLFLHRIEAEKELRPFGASSKLRSGWGFISRLRDIGYQAADDWLSKNRNNLGRCSTLELLYSNDDCVGITRQMPAP